MCMEIAEIAQSDLTRGFERGAGAMGGVRGMRMLSFTHPDGASWKQNSAL